ncbi:MAG: hypothetical protein FJX80_08135 [Bacteroidetes bacterium]|nr:hypothetical protein [Bacteroidota bacterium]
MKLLFQVFTIYLFFLTVSFTSSVFAQCDEYYINELISGVDDKCYFPEGSPVRFCPRLKGIAINGTTFDVMQWDGISTQYLTLTKNGGIAGTMVLKLKEKELLVNLNGCGGARTYSISLNQQEHNLWVANKPIREKEKEERLKREEEQKLQDELKAKKIEKIIKEHNLEGYYVNVDTSIVNNAIRNNDKFRKILELYDKDTLVIEFTDGKISNSAVLALDLVDSYCNKTWYYVRTDEFRRLPFEEQKKINDSWYDFCRREQSAWGYQYFSFSELFRINPYKDTIIEGERIPLKNFRVIIILEHKTTASVKQTNYIGAPQKFLGRKLYISFEPFSEKGLKYGGYYSFNPIENFEEATERLKCSISYERSDKDMYLKGPILKTVTANNIFISTYKDGEWHLWLKFKKSK